MSKFLHNAITAVAVLLFIGIGTSSCTENERARGFGGQSTVNLPNCQKLVNVTWKAANLWYLTRPFRPEDTIETYNFIEDSNWGVWNGTVFIKESCSKEKKLLRLQAAFVSCGFFVSNKKAPLTKEPGSVTVEAVGSLL
jgi:hypothetical protein